MVAVFSLSHSTSILTPPLLPLTPPLQENGKLSILLNDPAGKRTKGPTNCAFGGPNFADLYIAHLEADHIAKVHLGKPGHPLYDRR